MEIKVHLEVPPAKKNNLFWQWVGAFGVTALVLILTFLSMGSLNGGHIFLCLLLAVANATYGWFLYQAWNKMTTDQDYYSQLEDELRKEVKDLTEEVQRLQKALDEITKDKPHGIVDAIVDVFKGSDKKEETV